MKRSNLLLVLLSVILLSGLFITDYLLALQYAKTDLSDPYKNFQSISVKPFRALKITGGNGYSIRIVQGTNYNIRLMNSRKSFFTKTMSNDTLSVTFTVSNQNYQQPEATTVGLILFMPRVEFLQLSGTNNEVGPFRQDSLKIIQDKNTVTRIKQLKLDYLNMEGTGTSYCDFRLENNVESLTIDIKNAAVVNFNQVKFKNINPVLQDSSALVLHQESLDGMRIRR